jgi:hypothetical protein
VTERTETAYYEAGHAAALDALGFDPGDGASLRARIIMDAWARQ